MKAALVAACLWSSALVTGAEEAGPHHLIYLHGRIIQDRVVGQVRELTASRIPASRITVVDWAH
jgi:hypothetical protein